MLALFRNNEFTTVFLLAFYVGLTHLAALLGYVPPPVSVNTDGGVLYQAWFGWAAGQPFWSAVGAAVLVFIQALSVNRLADEFRLLENRNWLPGLFYALVASCLPDFLFLSPPLVAVTVVPPVLRRIFKVYKQPKATILIFDAVLWTTVGSLFYPPTIFLLIAVYAGINVMRAFNFREQLVLLTGVFVPVFLAWLWYFWTDRGWDLWRIQFGSLFNFYHFSPQIDDKMLFEGAFVGVILLTVLLSYGVYTFRKLIQTQKFVSVLYWFLFTGGLAMLLQREPLPAHLMFIMPAVGIMLAMSFSALRSRFLAEIFHLLLLGGVFFIQIGGVFRLV